LKYTSISLGIDKTCWVKMAKVI